MILRTPHYYKDFVCIASECKNNCCVGGWQIDIDDETAEFYTEVPGPFGDRLRESIDYTDAYCFKLKDGQCPFLDTKGLCQIYKELGEDKLGVVCTQFPRYSEYYGDIKETGIGLACEEAERIIFSDRKPWSYDLKEFNEEPVSDSEFDSELAKSLFVYRDKVIAFMDADIPEYSFTDKLHAIILTAFFMQECINNNTYEELRHSVNSLNLNQIISEISHDGKGVDFTACQGVYRLLCAYSYLENLNPEWPEALDEVFDLLHPVEDDESSEESITEDVSKAYTDTITDFMKYIAVHDRLYEYNNLIKYYVFRYFMKASYDHNILGKALLAISNWIVIRDMDMVRWLNNDKNYTFQDRIDTVHVFSRQVEYSEDNLWQLEEEFMFDDIFDVENICGLLNII